MLVQLYVDDSDLYMINKYLMELERPQQFGTVRLSEDEWIQIFHDLWPLSDTAKSKLRIIQGSNNRIIAKKEAHPEKSWFQVGWDMGDWLRETSCGTVGCALGNATFDLGLPVRFEECGRYFLDGPIKSYCSREMFEFLDIKEFVFDFLFLGRKYSENDMRVTPHHVNDRIEKLL